MEAEYQVKNTVALHKGEIEKKKLDLEMVAQYGTVYEKHELLAALRDQAQNQGQGNLAADLLLMGHLSSELGESGLLPKKTSNDPNTFETRIQKLVMMRDSALLSDEEFERKRLEILNSI